MQVYSPGTRIAGRYEVASRPLMGGMGIVYLCFDHEERRPVALKTFRPEFLPDRAARDRFLREGTTWVALGRHPHIVRCYEVMQPSTGPEVYLVLELVAKEQEREDASLRSWLTPGKAMPADYALLFALQIVRGMMHATEVLPGFVHRDLKPENVLVGADKLANSNVNRARVTDFGLASVLQEASDTAQDARGDDVGDAAGSNMRKTQLTHGIVGTPLYMAPEQWKREPVSTATDMYALGCILVELLTGKQAVEGKSIEALQRAHCAGQVHTLPTSLPECVQELAQRCLAAEPEARGGTWAEVEAALAGAYAQVCGQAAPESEPVQAINRAERLATGWSYCSIGASYLDIGKAEVAVGYFQRVTEVGRTERERGLEAAGLGNMGTAYYRLGDARQAIGCYEQALAIVREIGDRRSETNGVGNLGLAYVALGDVRQAIGCYEQALMIDREMGERRGEAANLGRLGEAYRLLGDVRRAISYCEQSLSIARAIDDRQNEASELMGLGLAYADLDDVWRAMSCYEQALAIAREIGSRGCEGSALGNLGIAYYRAGDVRRAISCHEEALEIDREIGDRRSEAHTLGSLGNVYDEMGNVRRAIGYYEQALAVAREIGDHGTEGIALGNLGLAYDKLGDAQQAIGYCEQALVIHDGIGAARDAGRHSFNLALLYAQQGKPERALPLAQRSAELYARVGDVERAQRSRDLAAQLRRG